jgi:putative oxidoreductase
MTMVDVGLLLLRISSGAIMVFAHGYPKLLRLFSGDEIKFADPLGIGMLPGFILVTIAEFLCALFVIAGLFTRINLLPLIIAMIVAVLLHHSPDPFAVKEKSLLFLVIYVTLLFTGPGKYSLSKFLPPKLQKL